jgi:spore coat protein U-like protein
MKNASLLKLLVVAALPLASASAFGATANANLAVSASVINNCSISTTPLAFGPYDPVVANLTAALNASGTVTVACAKGSTGLTIGMDNGAHYLAATTRQMLGGTSAGLLAYGLGMPPNSTPGTACTYPGTAWTTVAGGLLVLTSPTSKAARTYNVCGTVAGGQDVAVDASYTDTVVATINF